MEKRKSLTNVRALCEKFELQAATDENRSRSSLSGLTKSSSHTKLIASQVSSLHSINSTNNTNQEEFPLPSASIMKPRLSIPVPLPPSVLPTQILRPRPRPLSYSEATGSNSSLGMDNDQFDPSSSEEHFYQHLIPPPEKPPRTFLYDMLSDPPPLPLNPPFPSNNPTFFPDDKDATTLSSSQRLQRRKLPLAQTLSLPQSTQFDDLPDHNEGTGDEFISLHKRAGVFIELNNLKNKTKGISCRDDCNNNYGNRQKWDELYQVQSQKTSSTDMRSLHRISKASIRPIQVCNNTTTKGSLSQKFFHTRVHPSLQNRLVRANTEPDISTYLSQWKGIFIADTTDYGVSSESGILGDMVDGRKGNIASTNILANTNYYYPLGISAGLTGMTNREPLTAYHPAHRNVGILQAWEEFFEVPDAGGREAAWARYWSFITRFHPELQNSRQEALFYVHGTSVTVVPPQLQADFQCHIDSAKKDIPGRDYRPQYNHSNYYVGMTKSKSDWNLHQIGQTHFSRGDMSTFNSYAVPQVSKSSAIRAIGNSNNRPLQTKITSENCTKRLFNPRLPLPSSQKPQQLHPNPYQTPKGIHQSIQDLIHEIYPVRLDSIRSGKDCSTDSGIQLGAESLSSCDTPLTGESTPDTGDSDCENDTTTETLTTPRQVVEERKVYIRRVSSIRTTELLPLQRLLLNNRPLPHELIPSSSTSNDHHPNNHHRQEGRYGNPEEALFDTLLIIGIRRDDKTGAYHPIVKYKFPNSATLPDGIEQFCFPDSLEWPCHEGSTAQFYTLTITHADGTRRYGCCYRILPDGANICIPITYCIISRTRAIGFYRNVLKLLASRHGSSESDMAFIVKELYEESIPAPGKKLVINDPTSCLAPTSNEFETAEPLIIRRKADPRLENTDLFALLNSLDLSIVVKLLGSLLLERKIVLLCKHLNLLSMCVEALEAMLYPFSWQHTFVPILPLNMTELLEVPAPFVIGVLQSQVVPWDIKIDDGMVVDLDQHKVITCVGDEGSILPKRFNKKLRQALKSVQNLMDQSEYTKNVLISECFIRIFVETLGHYRADGIFEYTNSPIYQNGSVRKINTKIKHFNKELFLKSTSSKSNRDFLEWFTETSMFYQFIESRKKIDAKPGLFEQRCVEQLESNKETNLTPRGNVSWKNSNILSKGTAWLKGTFSKERE